ncbi:UDP-N-acetyl glucosamine:UMP antiporter, putative [Plasmodium gallinaceum]|uniref:UDP-N-acetyl glucosamine:UMP antiporter, putative n=1 Tax=Plasmodium gallinaceum TaxID=5849 RepID=A0A1J1GZD5_PLAGA|nr:UDP-N-acetyl glucosamine:UMP antiporter, putative [Plasmodium gallinaceum]CRG97830.1 UDP-N-acetyl glucosamine:UMP antiporter, putative [Plasmodium gallinaceum]
MKVKKYSTRINKTRYKNNGNDKNIFKNDLFFKAALFVVLTVQSVLTLLMIRMKKVKNINYKMKNESIIFLSEIIKFCVSFLFYFNENKFSLKLVSKNVGDIITRKKVYMLSLLVPSTLYYIQNIFFFISLSNIPTPLFQLLYQFRILTVVMFSLLILKKKFRNTQMLSIIFLFLSLVCLKDYNLNDNHPTYKKKINASIDNNTSKCYLYKELVDNNLNERIRNQNNFIYLNHKEKPLSSNRVLSFFFDENKNANIFEKIMNKNINKNILWNNRKKFGEIDYINNDFISNNNINIYESDIKSNNKSNNNFNYYNNRNSFCIDNIDNNNNKIGNILIGTLTTFLATFTSGFSNVYLEFLYSNYRFPFWFQSMCLSFFTIIIGSVTKNIDVHLVFNKYSNNKIPLGEYRRNYLSKDMDFKMSNIEEKKEIKNEEILFLQKLKNYFFQHFDSFNEFIYVFFLIFLHSTGGLTVAVFIKYVDSVSRFFITPISLIINVYISSMYFKDFNFTFNFFISLIFVFFALFLYFKKNC